MRKSFWRYKALALIGVGVMSALVWSLLPKPRHLLDGAVKIPLQEEWLYNYHWLSDRELLVFQIERRGKRGEEQSVPYRYDIRAGAKTPLGLAQRVSRDGESIHPAAAGLSPDGKWLLWNDFERKTLCAGRLDGSQILRWRGQHHWNELCWLEDSRRFLAKKFDSQDAALFDLQRPGSIQKLLCPQAEPYANAGINSSPLRRAGERILFLADNQDTVDLLDLPLGQQRARPWPPLQVPQGNHRALLASAKEIDISPSGDRLLVWVDALRTSPVQQGLYRFFPPSVERVPAQYELWVRRLDSPQMQRVAFMESKEETVLRKLPGNIEEHESTAASEAPYDLRWTPDGRHISFVFQGALWKIPVD